MLRTPFQTDDDSGKGRIPIALAHHHHPQFPPSPSKPVDHPLPHPSHLHLQQLTSHEFISSSSSSNNDPNNKPNINDVNDNAHCATSTRFKAPSVSSLKRKTSVSISDLDRLANVASRIVPNLNYFDQLPLLRSVQRLAFVCERTNRPSISVFHNNRDILPTMRCKLVNWLIEVSLHFGLHRETLYLAVHYIDRFLSIHWGVRRGSLQLLGIAALFIAAKLEIKQFAEICDGSCNNQDIHRMELSILSAIEWRLNHPTLYYWLGSYVELLRPHLLPDQLETVHSFVLEAIDLALHTPLCLLYSYSQITAAALFLRLADEKLIALVTGYSPTDLQACAQWIWNILQCPESIVYYSPDTKVSEDLFDSAMAINAQAMRFLMNMIRTQQ